MTLTRKQKRIKRLYTSVRGIPGHWTAYLHVGVQSFAVSLQQPYKADAEWFCNLLAIALTDIVDTEYIIRRTRSNDDDQENKERKTR